MRLKHFIISITLLFLWTCKSTKSATSTALANSKWSKSKLVKDNQKTAPKFNSLVAKLKINLKQDSKSMSHWVSFRMKKDDTIWISKLGLVKALITKERVAFYNKLERTYFDGDFNFLSDLLGTKITFKKLQNILLGQPMQVLDKDKYSKAIVDNLYVLNSIDNQPFFNFMFKIYPENFKLHSQQISEKATQRRLNIHYINYQEVSGYLFPKASQINAIDKDERTQLDLEFKSIELNQRLRFPFKIPSGYKKIE